LGEHERDAHRGCVPLMAHSSPQLPTATVASAARGAGTANSTGGYLPLDAGRPSNVNKLVITAISGASATLALTIEHADVAAGPWTAVDTFPNQTATTTGITRQVPGHGNPGLVKGWLRVAWTITGTSPSVTFSVTS